MKRGSKAKPTVLKVLGGAAKRRIPKEPDYLVGWPEMPTWLSSQGAGIWRYVMAQMEAAGVVRLIDRDLLGAYCDAVDCAIEASKKARTDGSYHAERRHSWTVARLLGAPVGIGPA